MPETQVNMFDEETRDLIESDNNRFFNTQNQNLKYYYCKLSYLKTIRNQNSSYFKRFVSPSPGRSLLESIRIFFRFGVFESPKETAPPIRRIISNQPNTLDFRLNIDQDSLNTWGGSYRTNDSISTFSVNANGEFLLQFNLVDLISILDNTSYVDPKGFMIAPCKDANDNIYFFFDTFSQSNFNPVVEFGLSSQAINLNGTGSGGDNVSSGARLPPPQP